MTMDKDLERYVLVYFSHLMTDKESKALRHLNSMGKLDSTNQNSNDQGKERRIKVYKEKGWLSEDDEVLALLDAGDNEFITRTTERILKDNLDKIRINNCPNCGQLARTPHARQCRHCGHSWR